MVPIIISRPLSNTNYNRAEWLELGRLTIAKVLVLYCSCVRECMKDGQIKTNQNNKINSDYKNNPLDKLPILLATFMYSTRPFVVQSIRYCCHWTVVAFEMIRIHLQSLKCFMSLIVYYSHQSNGSRRTMISLKCTLFVLIFFWFYP